MLSFFKRQSPVRIIAVGFLLVILLGSLLLSLPCSIKDGVRISYIDSLYTSTSAVCVTGLITIDPGDTFTPLGQFFLGMLIQIGGLGVAAIGTGVMLLLRKKMNFKERNIIRESMNFDSGKGVVSFLTVIIELFGALVSLTVFIKDYPLIDALGISIFHSVSAFNNSGFDIMGGFNSLVPYADNAVLTLITAFLIISGGIGFLVIKELVQKKFRWRKLSMHARVVLSTTAVLIVAGTLLLKLTENITWLQSFFNSVSARTAGFADVSLSSFTNSGIIIMVILMFVGASPGSTGGGIKTTTFFALLQGIKSSATNKSEKAFKYSMPKQAFRKAAVVSAIGICVVVTGIYLMGVFDPHIELRDVIFEITSAFATVGLSTGITPDLSSGSKILSMIIMFIGRLGPLTIATVWYYGKEERVEYPQGDISIG